LSENGHLDAAWQYHSGTKHSHLSVRTSPHSLDWENKPLLFKIYPTLEVMRLPRDFRETGSVALSVIAAPSVQGRAEAIPGLETLAQLLFFSAGVVRSKKHEQGETFFRAAACTGALYEIELYVVCTDLPGENIPGVKAPPNSACANSGPGISVRRSSRPPAAIHPSLMPRSRLFAPVPTGATPGNTAPAPTATSDGITALSLPIFWPCLKPRSSLPKL
jgi:hypothetical protein